jgi:predicted nucleotidyltransferase
VKKEKLINFINYYFKEFGNQQIIDEYSIDHDIDIYVHDIRKGLVMLFGKS